MQHIYVEVRSKADAPSVDLARHLYTRLAPEPTLIITDRPLALHSALRKQWQKLVRQVMVERARTINAIKIREFSHLQLTMQRMRFAARPPSEDIMFNVYLIQPDDIEKAPTDFCRTIYTLSTLTPGQLDLLTEKIIPHGLLVLYSAPSSAEDGELLDISHQDQIVQVQSMG